MERFIDLVVGILRESWIILAESAPWVLFGFFIAALMKAFIPDSFVRKHLGGNGSLWSIVKAALIGIPLPLCSCGVIPAATGLRKQGASKGATTSFLISTPETGVDSIAISWALLDPIMTVFRPVAAFVTAIFAGAMEIIFDKKDDSIPDSQLAEIAAITPQCGCNDGCAQSTPAVIENPGSKSRLTSSFNFAFTDLLADIGLWLLIGIVLAGAVSYAVPENYFETRLGTGFVSYIVMLAAGIPLYICATSSTPLAAAMILKGLSPGAALVFLIAGPATNIATITVVAKIMGKRTLTVYLVSIALCALIFGWLLDALYISFGIKMVPLIGSGHSEGIGWVNITASCILLLLIARSIWISKTHPYE